MKKIKNSNVIVLFITKSVVLTTVSILLLSAIVSFICLKFDIDTEILNYTSIVICTISSAITAYLSVKGFKNNGFALGAISALPLIIFSFINLLFNSTSGVIFIIKLICCILTGGLFGAISVNKAKRIKVK